MASRKYEGTSWKQADAFLRGSYGGKGAYDLTINLTIGNHTTMRRLGDDIAIRHWGTDIITYHPNGSTTLKIWDSVSTKARYSRWSVASVGSAGSGRGLAIWHRATDPITEPKLVKCSGENVWQSSVPGKRWGGYVRSQCRDGKVTRMRHAYLPCELGAACTIDLHMTWPRGETRGGPHDHYRAIGVQTKDCENCQGTGKVDRGSKQDPVSVSHGATVRVDKTGRVIGAKPSDRIYAGKALRAAALSAPRRSMNAKWPRT